MALSYPLTLPFDRFVSSRFQVVPIVAKTRTGSASFAREVGPAYWRADITTKGHTEIEFGRWLAFFDALRGGAKSFLLYDPHRCFPIAHPGHTGTATLVSISNPRQVSVSGLPGGFTLTAGDYIGFEQLGRYSLHRVLQDVSASGGSASVAIEPPLASQFTSGALVRLNKARGEFVLDTYDAERRGGPKRASFSATSRAY